MLKRPRHDEMQPPENVGVNAMTAHHWPRRSNAGPAPPGVDGAAQAVERATDRLDHAAIRPEDQKDLFQAIGKSAQELTGVPKQPSSLMGGSEVQPAPYNPLVGLEELGLEFVSSFSELELDYESPKKLTRRTLQRRLALLRMPNCIILESDASSAQDTDDNLTDCEVQDSHDYDTDGEAS